MPCSPFVSNLSICGVPGWGARFLEAGLQGCGRRLYTSAVVIAGACMPLQV